MARDTLVVIRIKEVDMRRRRAGLLAAVAALVLTTGVSGSALADDTPAEGQDVIVCTAGDGKVFELKPGVPVKIGDGKGEVMVTKAIPADVAHMKGGIVGQTRSWVAGETTDEVAGEAHGRAEHVEAHGTAEHLKAHGGAEHVEAVPATPAVPRGEHAEHSDAKPLLDENGEPVKIDMKEVPPGAMTIACKPK